MVKKSVVVGLSILLLGCGGSAIDAAAEKFAGLVDRGCSSGTVMTAQEVDRYLDQSFLAQAVRAKFRDAVRDTGNDIDLNLADAIVIECGN